MVGFWNKSSEEGSIFSIFVILRVPLRTKLSFKMAGTAFKSLTRVTLVIWEGGDWFLRGYFWGGYLGVGIYNCHDEMYTLFWNIYILPYAKRNYDVDCLLCYFFFRGKHTTLSLVLELRSRHTWLWNETEKSLFWFWNLSLYHIRASHSFGVFLHSGVIWCVVVVELLVFYIVRIVCAI